MGWKQEAQTAGFEANSLRLNVLSTPWLKRMSNCRKPVVSFVPLMGTSSRDAVRLRLLLKSRKARKLFAPSVATLPVVVVPFAPLIVQFGDRVEFVQVEMARNG